jgi:hypothetical protein
MPPSFEEEVGLFATGVIGDRCPEIGVGVGVSLLPDDEEGGVAEVFSIRGGGF